MKSDRHSKRERTRGEKGSLVGSHELLASNYLFVSCLSSLQCSRYDVNSLLVLLTPNPLNFCLQWPCLFFAPASELLNVVSELSPYAGATNRMGPKYPQGTFQGPSGMPSKTNMPRSVTTTVCTSELQYQSHTKNYRNAKESHCPSAWFVRLRSTSFGRKYIPRRALLARYHHGS